MTHKMKPHLLTSCNSIFRMITPTLTTCESAGKLACTAVRFIVADIETQLENGWATMHECSANIHTLAQLALPGKNSLQSLATDFKHDVQHFLASNIMCIVQRYVECPVLPTGDLVAGSDHAHVFAQAGFPVERQIFRVTVCVPADRCTRNELLTIPLVCYYHITDHSGCSALRSDCSRLQGLK